MPTLLDYRRRIRSVKSTQQITRAMKFVSAAKLRRAQEGVFAARPYAREILRVLRSAAARMESAAHPLLERRPEERILVVVLTGDRSLAGAFNTNVIRRATISSRELVEKDSVIAIGKKGRDTLRKRGVNLAGEYLNVSSRVEFLTAKEIAGKIAEIYANREVDAVYAIYNEFKNVIVQNLRSRNCCRSIRRCWTQTQSKTGTQADGQPTKTRCRTSYRPPGKRIARRLHLRGTGRRDFQRACAALSGIGNFSHSAGIGGGRTCRPHDGDGFRDAQCGRLIEKLTLEMNKIRQAGITKELIEIVSGAASANS